MLMCCCETYCLAKTGQQMLGRTENNAPCTPFATQKARLICKTGFNIEEDG